MHQPCSNPQCYAEWSVAQDQMIVRCRFCGFEYEDHKPRKEPMVNVRDVTHGQFAVMKPEDILEGQRLGNDEALLQLRKDRRELVLAVEELDRRIGLLEDHNDELDRLMTA